MVQKKVPSLFPRIHRGRAWVSQESICVYQSGLASHSPHLSETLLLQREGYRNRSIFDHQQNNHQHRSRIQVLLADGLLHRDRMHWPRRGMPQAFQKPWCYTAPDMTTAAICLRATGNLKAVMDAMGHTSVKVAMNYQHPELDIVRDAINSRHILRHTGETQTSVSG